MTDAYGIEYFNDDVLREIESWPVSVVAGYARLVELLIEFGPGVRMPHSRALGSGLFELRPRGRGGTGRAFYCFRVGQRVVVLHAFAKKSQAVPRREIEIARRRMREVRDGRWRV